MTERGQFDKQEYLKKWSVGAVRLAPIPSVHAATCPFDGGGSDVANDGIVLTRYASGSLARRSLRYYRYASLVCCK